MNKLTRSSFYVLVSTCCYLLLAGCENSNQASHETLTRRSKIRVLVVDDEPLANAIERAWKRDYGADENTGTPSNNAELVVKRIASDDVEDARRLGADVVVYPSWMLGTLAARELIVPLPRDVFNVPEFDREDIFALQRNKETVWRINDYAMSLGSPHLLLLYRRDVFDKLEIVPPTTWDDYDQVVKQLADCDAVVAKTDGTIALSSENWNASSIPAGGAWAGKMLLARAAASVTNRREYADLFEASTMRPLVAREPYVKALQSLVDGKESHHHTKSPKDSLVQLATGRCAMAITWPMKSLELTGDQPALPIGVAELPGTKSAYNFAEASWEERIKGEDDRTPLLATVGRMASMTDEANSPKAAANFVGMLAGVEWESRVTSQSAETTLFRRSQLSKLSNWIDVKAIDYDVEQLRSVIEESQSRHQGMFACRVPGHRRYMQSLDAAVTSALGGDVRVTEALQQAADDWAATTTELGVEKQRRAFTSSLGM